MPLRNSVPPLALMMLFAALGCGGSGIIPPKSTAVGPLTISPSQPASVTFGGSVQFQAYEGTIQVYEREVVCFAGHFGRFNQPKWPVYSAIFVHRSSIFRHSNCFRSRGSRDCLSHFLHHGQSDTEHILCNPEYPDSGHDCLDHTQRLRT